MARTRERMKGRRDGGLFVPIPADALESENLRTTPPHAMKLLFALMAQLDMRKGGPSNNGDLSAPLQTMQKQWGFRSPDTLNNCKNELLDRGFIAETRKGAFPKLCTLFGITFFSLNENPKLEITSRSFPRGAWRLWAPGKPVENTRLTTPAVSKSARVDTPGVSKGLSERPINTLGVSVRAQFPIPQIRQAYTFLDLPSGPAGVDLDVDSEIST